MRIKSLRIKAFKRFHELQITDLPATTRLVVMTGPNGAGKSSVFDAMSVWYGHHRDWGQFDPAYHENRGLTSGGWNDSVQVEFHQPVPSDAMDRKKMFYFRSAYRNEAEFTVNQFARSTPPLDDQHRVKRMIENDTHVSDDYRRLVAATIQGVYNTANDAKTVRDLRDELIGEVRASLQQVFPDLSLASTGNPLEDGSFFFTKGAATDFHYKNLSGGEKATFDLILDFVVKRRTYDATVFCIDEPDQHMSTRLQATLLDELYALVPDKCQLWITTHSIGMMRRAKQIRSDHSGEIAFLDFQDRDFDRMCSITPTIPGRHFWMRALKVALDDLAELVAPKDVVLCEGRPKGAANPAKAEFDAQCYRKIFADEFPETDFLSVGNAANVANDHLETGEAIQTLVPGTKVIRLIDRDDRSADEIAQFRTDGVRVLTVRHLEAYLMSDEILSALCQMVGKEETRPAVLAAKEHAIAESVKRGNPSDDIKSAAGTIYNETKCLLGLTQCGSTKEAFCRDTLAPLVRNGTQTYADLRADILGP